MDHAFTSDGESSLALNCLLCLVMEHEPWEEPAPQADRDLRVSILPKACGSPRSSGGGLWWIPALPVALLVTFCWQLSFTGLEYSASP